MEIQEVHTITFDIKGDIVAASPVNANEFIMFLSSGEVWRYKISDNTATCLFEIKEEGVSYADGGFKLDNSCSIYILDEIVVVVNDFGRHGYVHYPGKYHKLHLWRGDYHADISRYPIALFRNEEGIPHLIYGVDWNHVQIMNLDTRQILTAAKSLTEELAEEKHIEFYKRYPVGDKLPWPRPYDYFFGELLMSPDNREFLSRGWVWGSADCFNIFNVDDFISNARIRYKNVATWEHEVRAVCWVDSHTVAVVYDPFVEGEEGGKQDDPKEVHFYSVNEQEPVVVRKFKLGTGGKRSKDIFYSKGLNALVAIYREQGVIVTDLDGNVLMEDKDFKARKFYPETNLFFSFKDQAVSISRLKTD